MKKNMRLLLITSILFGLIFFLSQCFNANEVSTDARGIVFANPASCRKCHQAIYDSVMLTAHYNATTPTSQNTVHGNFNEGQNSYVYDSSTKVVMQKRDSGLYQALYLNGKEMEAHRFDITFGVRNAQTWLYWKGNNTYELPVSYYTSANAWGTSPGFPIAQPYFKRIVGKVCFECHSSFIDSKHSDETSNSKEYFAAAERIEAMDKTTLIYGIDCQRCHGPAANHVNYHTIYPEEKKAKYIVTNSSLNAQQKLDMCAVCHSGNDQEKLKSRFYFKPGDTLSNFYLYMPGDKYKTNFDVHGNQQRLLAESKCFLQSGTLNCSSCHNPHTNASSNLATYSQKCMGCHTEANKNFCIVKPAAGISIKDNCIDCHMPKKPSEAISFYQQGNTQLSFYLLRTHKIGIYKTDSVSKPKITSKKVNKGN